MFAKFTTLLTMFSLCSAFVVPSSSMATKRPVLAMVSVGQAAPDFSLKDQNGKTVTLSSFKGKKNVVVYFYPKDDTPGCTKQACAFNTDIEEFKQLGAEVIGISSDEDHAPFIIKYGLRFTLLSDVGGKVRSAWKVPKSLFGVLDGRVTYIIGKDGIVKKVYDNQFAPETHIDEALAVLSAAK